MPFQNIYVFLIKNINMILDKLINYLKLDKQEFIFQFNSHPNYPSALAFSDTLNFMGLKNEAYELDKEYWDELPEEFITIVDQSFSVVKKTGTQYSIYSDTTQIINKKELYQKTSEFVLLFEKTENVYQRYIYDFKYFIYSIILIFILYSALNHIWYEFIFNILSLVGLYVSLEIYNQKFGNTSSIINTICGNIPSVNQNTNSCNKIISEDKAHILGLKFSDFSLIYFIGLSILGLFLPTTSFIIKGFTFASAIAIAYSLYIQAVKEKQFCLVCLLIISILTLQIGVSFFLFESLIFNYNILLLAIILWLTAAATIIYLNIIFQEKETLQKSNARNLRFKRNYDIFKRELLENERINFKDNQTFSLGSKDAKIHISLVSNLYCGFCKEAHKILKDLLKKYPNDISIQIRFNYTLERTDEKLNRLISKLIYLYKNKSEDIFLDAIEDWFISRNKNTIKANIDENFNQEDLEPLVNISKENSLAGLNFTPVFIINGYQFPEKYDREDIYYFIEDLIEDENI